MNTTYARKGLAFSSVKPFMWEVDFTQLIVELGLGTFLVELFWV